MTEGDQRFMAKQLLSILDGSTSPRSKTPVPDILETASAMKSLYEEL
jgi:hypothetical protein